MWLANGSQTSSRMNWVKYIDHTLQSKLNTTPTDLFVFFLLSSLLQLNMHMPNFRVDKQINSALVLIFHSQCKEERVSLHWAWLRFCLSRVNCRRVLRCVNNQCFSLVISFMEARILYVIIYLLLHLLSICYSCSTHRFLRCKYKTWLLMPAH